MSYYKPYASEADYLRGRGKPRDPNNNGTNIRPGEDELSASERITGQKKRVDALRQAKKDVDDWKNVNLAPDLRMQLYKKYGGNAPEGAFLPPATKAQLDAQIDNEQYAEELKRRKRQSDMGDELRKYNEIKEYNRSVPGGGRSF